MGLAVIRCTRRCYAYYFKDFRRYNKLFNSVRIEADASETSLDLMIQSDWLLHQWDFSCRFWQSLLYLASFLQTLQNPSIYFLNRLSNPRSQGSWSPSKTALAMRWITPRTGNSITGLTQRDRQPFALSSTPTAYLQSPINLTCTSLDCESKSQYQMESVHTNSTQEGPGNQESTRHFCLWGKRANYCTIVLWCAIALINQWKTLFIYLFNHMPGDWRVKGPIFYLSKGVWHEGLDTLVIFVFCCHQLFA